MKSSSPRSAADQVDSTHTSGVAEASTTALAPHEVRRALRISVVEGAVATIHISITGAIGGSVFLTGFAILLGANSFQLGILGALPFIGQLTQFVGAYLEERVGNRRNLVLYGALSARMIWALLLSLPFLSFLQGAQLLVFLIGLGFTYALNGIAGNAWMSWMSDLVPPHRRGSYFGLRNTIAAIAAMASTYLAGRTLDQFREQSNEPLGYAVIFGVAVIAALGAALLIAQQAEPPLQKHARVNLTEMFGAPLRDRSFRNFAATAFGWAIVLGIATPFFNAYGLTTLKLSFATLSLMSVVTSAVSLISGPLAGQLQDRFGYRITVVGCALGTVILPLGWVFATPTNLLPLWLNVIFAGVFWPGLNQGLANVLMERAPTTSRGAAIAAYGALTGFGTLASGILGGIIASLIVDTQMVIGPVTITGFAFLFLLTVLGRAIMVPIFWRAL